MSSIKPLIDFKIRTLVLLVLLSVLFTSAQSQSNWLALLSAAKNNDLRLVSQLLAQGANVNIRNEKGWTSLIISAFQGQRKMVELLLDYQANVHLQLLPA